MFSWNHAACLKQKQTLRNKFFIICKWSSNMGNNSRRNSGIIWRHQFLSINTHRQSYDTSNNDLDYLKTRTKLTRRHRQINKFFLSKSNCVYENKIRLSENAGPIGLSLMVILSSYLQHLEPKTIVEALTMHIQRKTFKQCVEDSRVRFPSKHQANTFQEIRNNESGLIEAATKGVL